MSHLHDENFVYVNGTIKAVTERAVLLLHDHGEAWIPKSQIEDSEDYGRGEVVRLMIPRWVAEAKEIACE